MWPHLIVLMAIAAPLFLWGIGDMPLRDPDEGLYASIAREMVDSGDWVTPRFNGLRYLEKPPLYHWLTALTYQLFGFSDWGARLWAALGSIGTVLLTALLGRELYGGRTGAVAGLLCASSLGVFLYGRFAGVDLVFTMLLTWSFLCFLRWNQKGGTLLRLGFYLGVALMILTKGALGLLFPAVVIAGLCLKPPRPRFREFGLWWGLLLVLAVVLPWHLAASRANPGFLSYYLVETHLVRFLHGTGAIEDEPPLSTGGFLLVSLIWFFPWSLFLPSALIDLRRRWHSMAVSERVAFRLIMVWAGSLFSIFAVSAFKLEHYALPAFPALALLVAPLWTEKRGGRLVTVPLMAGVAGTLIGCVGALALGGATTSGWLDNLLAGFTVYFRMLLEEGSLLPLPPLDVLWRLIQCMLGALFLGFLAAALALRRGAMQTAFGCLLLGTVGFLFTVWMLLVAIAPFLSVRAVAQTVRRLASPTDVVLYEGYLENAGGLPYYTGRQIHILGPPRGDLAFGSRYPEAKGLFHEPKELLDLWQGSRRVFLVTDRPRRQSAIQSIPPESSHLLLLDHRKWLYSNRPGEYRLDAIRSHSGRVGDVAGRCCGESWRPHWCSGTAVSFAGAADGPRPGRNAAPQYFSWSAAPQSLLSVKGITEMLEFRRSRFSATTALPTTVPIAADSTASESQCLSM